MELLQESAREFSYVGLSSDQMIRHIAHFTANLWQIHAFGEGNTRTTGVFVIKYLRTLGFDVRNDVFAENAWYFRNALVRANYTNIPKGIEETPVYLETFFRNLLLGERNVLQSRYLMIGGWKGGDDPTSNPTSKTSTDRVGELQLSESSSSNMPMTRASSRRACSASGCLHAASSRWTRSDTTSAPS